MNRFSSIRPTGLMATLMTVSLLAIPVLNHRLAQAQVGVSPLVIETQAQRGQAQGTLTIRNPSDQPSRARIYTEAFTYDRATGFKVLPESENDLSPYLRFSPREMTIPPGEERRVRFIAQLPPDIPEGEYRTVMFTETLIEATDSEQNTVGIQARIGATVYVRVGDVAPALKVEETRYNPQEQEIELLTANSGKASARVAVAWQLSHNGETIAQGEAPETSVIAQRDRFLSLTLPPEQTEPLSPGTYQLQGELIWGSGNDPNTQAFEVKINVDKTIGITSEDES